tara:strand:- start:194 stop:472 length:279 start_codon:yes stop_codon:yes gene_type:complete
MNLTLIEKQLEKIDEVLFNLQVSEKNLTNIKEDCNKDFWKLVWNEKKRTHKIEIARKVFEKWMERYLKEFETLRELNKAFRHDQLPFAITKQ